MTEGDIFYKDYEDESVLPAIQKLVARDLSEPYSVFTYRYFIHGWPSLCICVFAKSSESESVENAELIGVVMGKAEVEYDKIYRGYVAMLAVNESYRKRGIGQQLVRNLIDRMVEMGCDEVTLETELINTKALNLYEKLGFMRVEKLGRYYLNGGDAYRLKFFIVKEDSQQEIAGHNEDQT
jgi:peptide alpha-N-acetyltransferase